MNDFKRKLTPAQVCVTFILVLLPVVLIFYFVWNGYSLEDFTALQKLIAIIVVVVIYIFGNRFLERGMEKPPINWFKNPVGAVEYGVATKKRYLTRVLEHCLMFVIIWMSAEPINPSRPMTAIFPLVLFVFLVLFPSLYLYAIHKRLNQ